MHDLKIGESDLLSVLRPDSLAGALVYLVLFVIMAMLLSRALRAAVHAAMTRQGHLDLTTVSFMQQLGSALIWVLALILYAHLIPVLRSLGTALLAGASIASVIIGLAAQSTLGNLVAGVSIALYRPFHLGDTLQVATPTGTEIGDVQAISLGYTTLRTADGRVVVLPNSLAASQVVINLNRKLAPATISIAISVRRETDAEAVRRAAQEVAAELVGKENVDGCLLTRIAADSATFELKARLPADADRDSTRAKLLSRLAQHFAEAGLDPKEGQRPSFT